MQRGEVLGLLVQGQGGGILPLLLSGVEPVETVPDDWYRQSNHQHPEYRTETAQDFPESCYRDYISISNLEMSILIILQMNQIKSINQ